MKSGHEITSRKCLWTKSIPYSRLVFGILLTASFMLIALSWGCSAGNDGAPHAKGGVIDFSAVDLSTSDPVKLDGEW